MPASIFSGNSVKILKNILQFNDDTQITSGTDDPRVTATNGTVGDLYISTTAGKVFQKQDTGSTQNWQELGSGSGGVGKSYYSDRNGEKSVNYVAFDDGAVSEPVDGSGGSPANLSVALKTSSQFWGENSSVEITKSAANAQGQGIRWQTDIDLDSNVTSGERVYIKFRYKTGSDYLTAGENISLWYYRVNGTDPGPHPLTGVDGLGNRGNQLNHDPTNRGQFHAVAEADSGTTNIRIIAMVTDTDATAYTVELNDFEIRTESFVYASSGVVGEVISFANDSVPNDFLECNGAAVSRSTYADLFAVIGTTWGSGDGSTTFNLPDLQNEFIRGDGTSSVGTAEGDSTALPNSSFTGSTSPNGAHNHSGTYHQQSASAGTAVAYASTLNPSTTSSVPSDGTHTHTVTISGGGDSETRPQNVRVKFCIRYQRTGSNALSSTQVDFTNYHLFAASNNGQTIATGGTIVYEDVIEETYAGPYNSSTGVWTAPVDGLYHILGTNRIDDASVSDRVLTVIEVNGAGIVRGQNDSVDTGYPIVVTQMTRKLSKGDTVEFVMDHSEGGSTTLRTSQLENYLNITKLPDVSVVGLLGQSSAPAETVQKFTSGSGTYTTPADATRLKVTIQAGGGGGGGSGTTAAGAAGGAGGNTTFGTRTATGGGGGDRLSAGTGGSWSGSGYTPVEEIRGGYGGGGGVNPSTANGTQLAGGSGGDSWLGKGGFASAGSSGTPGLGFGGGGAGAGNDNTSAQQSGGGGGGGGAQVFWIDNPAVSYSYSVGSGGAAGTLGGTGRNGSAGTDGIIIVEEFYY